MAVDVENSPWHPGSFTKNYTWGQPENGLRALYDSIRLGFADSVEDVSREEFRERHAKAHRPDFIPINFFLFNYTKGGVDYVLADELVFQALKFDHSARFDKLALFALNFTMAGQWKGALPYQRRPALWALHYVRDRVARRANWDVRPTADDIENFIRADRRYTGRTTRKVSTNLAYLYRVGGLRHFNTKRVERWWVDAMFLALDRCIEDRKIDGLETSETAYNSVLMSSGFSELSGPWSTEKQLAAKHLVTLYTACGSRERFIEEQVQELTALRLPDVAWILSNHDEPSGAVHPTNPAVLKSIPRACAMLARYAGFDVIDFDELEQFDAESFVRKHTKDALLSLKTRGVRSRLSPEELIRQTRDE